MKNAATKASKATAKAKAASTAVRRGKTEPAPPAESLSPPPAPLIGQDDQSDLFDKAIVKFRSGDFAQAKKIFEKVAAGPTREIAHVARIHLQICERRLSQAAPAPSSEEDHYNLAIAHINRRELEAAEKHLLEALRLAPEGGHIHYAMALTRGLKGQFQQAFESMKRAIEIDPRNRAQARSDPDFAGFSYQQPLAALLFPDRERHT